MDIWLARKSMSHINFINSANVRSGCYVWGTVKDKFSHISFRAEIFKMFAHSSFGLLVYFRNRVDAKVKGIMLDTNALCV